MCVRDLALCRPASIFTSNAARPTPLTLLAPMPMSHTALRFALCSTTVFVATAVFQPAAAVDLNVVVETASTIKRNEAGAIVDVDLSDQAVDDKVVDAVAALDSLSVLRLRRTAISDAQLAKLAHLKLRMVDLRNTNISDAGLVHLAKIPSLVDIQLEKSKVTDDGIRALKDLSLKSFNINYCTSVSNEGLAVVAAMPSMEQLQFDYTSIDDDGMAVLAAAANLKRLRIRGVDVTGVGIAQLAELTNLSRLNLRDTSLDDAGLKVIAQLPKLDWLDISECRLVTPSGIAQLGQASTLTYLDLWETKADDESLAALTGLKNLTVLNLMATSVTDAALPALLKFEQLVELNVAGTQLADESFLALGRLPALKKLNVANTGIGFDTIDTLIESRDDLEVIEFEH